MANPWDNDTTLGQPTPQSTNNQPQQPMPWDKDTAAGAVPSSADQIGPAQPFMQQMGNYAQDAAVGAAKTGAHLVDALAPVGGDVPVASTYADQYLPAYKSKIMGAGAEGATMGAALAGVPGAVIGGTTGAGTEYLNQVRPDHPIANILEPAAVAMLAAPKSIGAVLKLGRIGLEELGVVNKPDLVQAKIDQGITAATPASTTDSDFWYKMQRSIRETLFGKAINKTEKAEKEQLTGAINNQADTLGSPMTKQEFGTGASKDLGDGVKMAKDLFSTQHTILDRMVDPNVPVIDMYPTVRRLIDSLSAAKGAQEFTEGLGITPLSHVENMMNGIINVGQGDKLSIAAVRQMRQAVGDKLEESILNGDASKRSLKIMYGALADAEETAYQGTNAYTDYKQLKEAESHFYPAIENFVEPLLKEGLKPEQIADKLASGMKLGGTGLEKVLPILEQQAPAMKDVYSGMILRGLGNDRQGNFNPNRFFTNWQNISPEAKQMLFGTGPNRDLPKAYDQLALIAENQARGAAAVNPSRTAGTTEIFSLLSRFGAVAGGIGGYEASANSSNNAQDNTSTNLGAAAAGSIAMSTIGAAAIGRMMTNPAFIRWLATPTPIGDVPGHIRLLGAIAGNYPALKNDINNFTGYMQNSLGLNTHEKPHEAVETYNDKLEPFAERGFAEWKQKYAPHDSGEDYDLKGAYEAGLTPDETGHWPDTFKKPNHPTFSDESKHSKENPDLPKGSWQGEHFFPPAPMANGGIAADPFGQPPQNGNIQGYSEGGHVPANENEFPGSLIDMITGGHNIIPFKSGAAGGHSGVQYDMPISVKPGMTSGAIRKPPNEMPEVLWTANNPNIPVSKEFNVGINANNNTNLKALQELRERIPKDIMLFGEGSPQSGAVLKPGSGAQWEYNQLDSPVIPGENGIGLPANSNQLRPGLPKDAWRYRPPEEEFAQGGPVNEESILDLIMKHESHGQNVMNYIRDKTHTAQGYYQITNSTWRDFAPKEILNKYPNAMSAPPDVQREVARIIYEAPNGGIGRWANYNSNLKAALNGKGLPKEGSNMASNATSGKMPVQEQQTEQQHQEPELQDQNKPLIDSIMGANWIEPTTKLASKAILRGET